jgi:hypothetical protein
MLVGVPHDALDSSVADDRTESYKLPPGGSFNVCFCYQTNSQIFVDPVAPGGLYWTDKHPRPKR